MFARNILMPVLAMKVCRVRFSAPDMNLRDRQTSTCLFNIAQKIRQQTRYVGFCMSTNKALKVCLYTQESNR